MFPMFALAMGAIPTRCSRARRAARGGSSVKFTPRPRQNGLLVGASERARARTGAGPNSVSPSSLDTNLKLPQVIELPPIAARRGVITYLVVYVNPSVPESEKLQL